MTGSERRRYIKETQTHDDEETPTYCTMDASEWTYIGEGGKHAVFSYRGDENEWNGRVLRIPKDVLSAAAPNKNASKDVIPIRHTDCYMETIVKPLLRQYIDIPKVISLEYKFLAELRDQTLSSSSEGVIPQSRRQDWTLGCILHSQKDASSGSTLVELSTNESCFFCRQQHLYGTQAKGWLYGMLAIGASQSSNQVLQNEV